VGQPSPQGELAIVAELRLAPAGVVWVHLRTVDGRKWIASEEHSIEPA
jgi:hypothetical protein